VGGALDLFPGIDWAAQDDHHIDVGAVAGLATCKGLVENAFVQAIPVETLQRSAQFA